MSKKIVYITGVSSGIGEALFIDLAAKGYVVIGTVRNYDDQDRLLSMHSNQYVLKYDVTDLNDWETVHKPVQKLIEENGLYALINNAGIAVPGPLAYLSDEEFEGQMRVNVHSVFAITKRLLPYLGLGTTHRPGRIINISSVSGLFNSPFNGAYCISKHAIESMTDILRRELSSFGIQVTAIEPGPIQSKIWQKNIGKFEKYIQTPFGKMAPLADKMIANSEKNALPTHTITALVSKILSTTKPKTRYLVHKKPLLFKLMAFYMPDRWADYLIYRALAKGKKYRPV